MLEVIVGLIGTGLLGVIGWGIKLSNRVAVLESLSVTTQKLLEVQLQDIKERLVRIEANMDKHTL